MLRFCLVVSLKVDPEIDEHRMRTAAALDVFMIILSRCGGKDAVLFFFFFFFFFLLATFICIFRDVFLFVCRGFRYFHPVKTEGAHIIRKK